MCTVVFIPVKYGYYFASLRDEDPLRQQAVNPTLIQSNESCYIAPTDPLGGGTWVGANDYGNVIILLNGGFKNHTKAGNYAQSRGIIVTELLTVPIPVAAWHTMPLNNIEPFTLIVWSEENLFQLVWDGSQKHCINLSKHKAHIWSSSTLYTADAKDMRKELFCKWMRTEPDISKSAVLNFFSEHHDSYNGFLINRNEKVKTLSYTFITLQKGNSVTMHYHDLSTDTQYHSTIAVSSKERSCSDNF
jgi:Transport and Golgi organisation 2